MHEKIIEISGINPLELFGANEVKLKLIKSFFPKLKVVARGANLKVLGEKVLLDEFSEAINLLIQHFEKYNDLTENNIKNVLGGKLGSVGGSSKGDDIIVHGNRGRHVKARTVNQRKMVDVLEDNDMLLVCDSVGCGRAHHMSCSSLELKRLDFWRCDMCVIAERVARRRRWEASDMAVINGWQRKAAGAMEVGTTRKRARFSGSATGH